MKSRKILTLVAVLAMLFVAVMPASAQLGQSDISSFTIQNIDASEQAQVSVTFVTEDGTEYTPDCLRQDGDGNCVKANPFTLDAGASYEVYVPGIPTSELPSGRYSVVISSSTQVVAIANLVGSGNINFNGSYSGFSGGATDFYLPAVVYNYYGWYSLISVQNVSGSAADVEITISCDNGTTGTLQASGIPANASKHFDLRSDAVTGFDTDTQCNGSAAVNATQNVVVVDNQRTPAGGNTQSFSGVSGGGATLFAPALYKNYFGWQGSMNIQKIETGDANVTVTFSNGSTTDCALTDAAPGCLVYMPTAYASDPSERVTTGATVTSDSGKQLVGVINAANGSQAQTYNAITGGTATVGIPSVMKAYYGWNTSFTCQNVGSVDTTLNISYAGYTGNAYNTEELGTGENVEKYTPAEAFLPAGHQGGVTVTANEAGAQIACIVNFNNGTNMGDATLPGDWSMSYNAFNK